jgi:large subunit ribosomal protein L10e
MRGAFGKPNGKAARVSIGDILFSVRVKPQHGKIALEALRRAKNKFPGRQKVVMSSKYGFTNLTHPQYHKLKAEGKIIPDGAHVKVLTQHGPLSRLPIFRN